MKCSSEVLQNLPCFWNTKTYIFFSLDQTGHSLGEKNEVSRNRKHEKNFMGFRITKIWQILNRFAGTFHQA